MNCGPAINVSARPQQTPRIVAIRKKTPDPRHMQVKELLQKYWAAENPDAQQMPWGAADAGALSSFLKDSPSLTVEQIAQMLRHRFVSEDHAAGERVFVWIRFLTRYQQGPLNKYKQPKESRNGTAQPNRTDRGNQQIADATTAALERLREMDRD
jgi:hypothetical protein